MLKDFYIFPCVFSYRGESIVVYFPDLEGCVANGQDEQEALTNAKEALSFYLYDMEQNNKDIPNSSQLKDLCTGDGERSLFVEIFMPTFRAKQENKCIRKNLTIPNWLNIEAERSGVNFSQVLQKGLKEHLKMNHNS